MHPLYVSGSLTYLRQAVIDERLDDFPLVLNIEPTDACNLRCEYCPPKLRPPSLMPLWMFQEVIDQLPDRRIMLNLHKDGEPTIHPMFPEMVEIAQASGKFETVHFNTNGTLYRDVRGCDITISIDAALPETYALTKGSDRLHDVEGNAKRYRENNHVRVKCIESVGPAEIELFKEKWQGWEVQTHPEHKWTDGADRQKDRKPCRLLQYALAVNADGTCSVCNFDWEHKGIVGNYNDIRSAYHNSRLLFEGHKKGIYAPGCCVKCENWRCNDGDHC